MSTMNSMPVVVSIDDLKATRFAIPFYQRSYCWSAEEAKAMLNDLKEDFYGHFCRQIERNDLFFGAEYYSRLGNIFVSESTDEHGAVAHVVDGQQRMTTLVLLCLAVIQLAQDQGVTDQLSAFVRTQTGAKSNGPMIGYVCRISLRDAGERLFMNFLSEHVHELGNDTGLARKEARRIFQMNNTNKQFAKGDTGIPALCAAYGALVEAVHGFVEGVVKEMRHADKSAATLKAKVWRMLAHAIAHRIKLIKIVVAEAQAIRVFERANSRRVQLSEIDIVRIRERGNGR